MSLFCIIFNDSQAFCLGKIWARFSRLLWNYHDRNIFKILAHHSKLFRQLMIYENSKFKSLFHFRWNVTSVRRFVNLSSQYSKKQPIISPFIIRSRNVFFNKSTTIKCIHIPNFRISMSDWFISGRKSNWQKHIFEKTFSRLKSIEWYTNICTLLKYA